jgi:hypothetical protein
MLVGGAALAQPPADSERYPPAPELPGVVVGQTAGNRPIITADALTTRRTSLKPAEPGPLPEKTPPMAIPPVATTTVLAPVTPLAPVAPCAPDSKCAKAESCTGGFGHFKDWLLHRSRSRQSGCYIPPYTPPLQAWFQCEPRKAPCGPCASGTKTCCPVPGFATAQLVPPTLTEEPPTLPGGEKLLVPPGKPDVKEPEAMKGFKPVDVGLSFAPGAAPMACPTTQTEKVSNWRPK